MTHLPSNRQLNISSAGQIALVLDKSDNKQDGKIEKNVWETFWQSQEVSCKKQLAEGETINVREAMNLIMNGLFNLARKTGENVNQLGNDWLGKINPDCEVIDANSIEELKEETDGTSGTGSSEGTGGSERGQRTGGSSRQGKAYTTDSIKVKVPVRYSSDKVKGIIKNREEGKALHDALKKGDTSKLTPENVAHAFTSDINFGPNTTKQATAVFKALVQRMVDLKIFKNGKDYGRYASFNQLPFAKQNAILHEYRNRIVTAENEIIKADNEKKTDAVKDQKNFDKANQKLVSAANDKSLIESVEKTDNLVTVKLKDGTLIYIGVDKNTKKIKYVNLTGYEKDDTTVKYSDESADSWTDDGIKDNGAWQSKYNTGYNWDKIKEIAQSLISDEVNTDDTAAASDAAGGSEGAGGADDSKGTETATEGDAADEAGSSSTVTTDKCIKKGKDIYYHKGSKTFYREKDGNLEPMKPRINGAHITQVFDDGSWIERANGITGFTVLKVNSSGNIQKSTSYRNGKAEYSYEYDDNGDLKKYTSHTIGYTNSFKNGILTKQVKHKPRKEFTFEITKDLGNDKFVLKSSNGEYILFQKGFNNFDCVCDKDGNPLK